MKKSVKKLSLSKIKVAALKDTYLILGGNEPDDRSDRPDCPKTFDKKDIPGN